MVGIGEQDEEVFALLRDLHAAGCDILTIGQYLQPTKEHLPVTRYVPMEMFQAYKEYGLHIGFEVVESSPLVRSSYHADEQAKKVI
jgi:lipoic acid synthetase